VNTLKCERRKDALRAIRSAGFDARSTPWSPLGIRLEERTALGKIPGLLYGIVEPMDEGSQLVASLVAAQPGMTVANYYSGSREQDIANFFRNGKQGKTLLYEFQRRQT